MLMQNAAHFDRAMEECLLDLRATLSFTASAP